MICVVTWEVGPLQRLSPLSSAVLLTAPIHVQGHQHMASAGLLHSSDRLPRPFFVLGGPVGCAAVLLPVKADRHTCMTHPRFGLGIKRGRAVPPSASVHRGVVVQPWVVWCVVVQGGVCCVVCKHVASAGGVQASGRKGIQQYMRLHNSICSPPPHNPCPVEEHRNSHSRTACTFRVLLPLLGSEVVRVRRWLHALHLCCCYILLAALACLVCLSISTPISMTRSGVAGSQTWVCLSAECC
jgi:hypothetical protein